MLLASVGAGCAHSTKGHGISGGEDFPSVTFRSFDKEIWTLKIEPERIAGGQNVLKRDGDFIIGFVGEQRIRIEVSHVKGNPGVWSRRELVYLESSDDHVNVSSPYGSGRVILQGQKRKIRLTNQSLSVTFLIEDYDSARKRLKLQDESGRFVLEFNGCDLSIFTKRPELMLIVNRTVLAKAAYVDDVKIRVR